jgi:hypothetical protein
MARHVVSTALVVLYSLVAIVLAAQVRALILARAKKTG